MQNKKYVMHIQHKVIQLKNYNQQAQGDCKETDFVFMSAATYCCSSFF